MNVATFVTLQVGDIVSTRGAERFSLEGCMVYVPTRELTFVSFCGPDGDPDDPPRQAVFQRAMDDRIVLHHEALLDAFQQANVKRVGKLTTESPCELLLATAAS
jgi:hypothetical protein